MAQRRLVPALTLALALGLIGTACPGLAAPLVGGPAWADLTPSQQQILGQLSGTWNTLEKQRREKWIGIARRYPSMTPEEQQRVQSRMRDWVALTPEQRRAARERYKDLQKIPPDQREALKQKWEAFESLSPEERKRPAPAARPSTGATAGGLSAKPPRPVTERLRSPSATPQPSSAATTPAKPAAEQSVASPSPAPAATPHEGDISTVEAGVK